MSFAAVQKHVAVLVLPATLSAHELAALGVHGSALLFEDGGARAVGATAVSPG
ncbi:MAG TPA: hypothetical protein VK283_11525 [Acidimicrobiales bacterium]|nr:hypothetical protein [Acidimicrobiales bacterium]